MPKIRSNYRIMLTMALAALLMMVKCGGGDTGTGAAGDTTRPIHGSALKFSDIKYNSFVLSWGEASDNITLVGSLVYKVVIADSYDKLNLVSRANALTGEGIVSDWSSYLPSVSVSGLDSETIYWLNVIVKDEAGNMEVYEIGRAHV